MVVRAVVADASSPAILMDVMDRVLDMLGLPAQRGLPQKVRKISRQLVEAGQQRRERADRRRRSPPCTVPLAKALSRIASFE